MDFKAPLPVAILRRRLQHLPGHPVQGDLRRRLPRGVPPLGARPRLHVT